MPSVVLPHQCSWLVPISWEFAGTGRFLCGSHRDYPLLPVLEAWFELYLVPVRGSFGLQFLFLKFLFIIIIGSQFLVVEWELHSHKAQWTLRSLHYIVPASWAFLALLPALLLKHLSKSNQYSCRGLLIFIFIFWPGILRRSLSSFFLSLLLSLLSFNFYINFKKHKNSETKHKLCCGDCLRGDERKGRGREKCEEGLLHSRAGLCDSANQDTQGVGTHSFQTNLFSYSGESAMRKATVHGTWFTHTGSLKMPMTCLPVLSGTLSLFHSFLLTSCSTDAWESCPSTYQGMPVHPFADHKLYETKYFLS